MIKILFTGKNLRVRRRETIKFPPNGFEFVTQQSIEEMPADHKLTNQREDKKITGKINNLLNYGIHIKKRFLKGVDIIYSPGKIILNRKPWIIEVDNVACMAFYVPKLLEVLKFFYKIMLKSRYCKGIVCLSEAAKKGVINYFRDDVISEKCYVVYPYAKEQKHEVKEAKGKIKFLFISSVFYVKGGREILNTFEKLENENVHLTIIAKEKGILDDHMKKIRENKKITFVEANLSKEAVYKYYQNCDVFLVPTYRDSFGLVYLEALSFGMPIIATEQYNLTELVDGNGYLIEPAFYYFRKDNTPNPKYWRKDLEEYILRNNYENVEEELYKVIKEITGSPEKIRKMSERSLQIFKESFSSEVRKRKFGEVLKKCAE